MDDEFSAAERRGLRRMLAWFRSAADSDDESQVGAQRPQPFRQTTSSGPMPDLPFCSESQPASSVWEAVEPTAGSGNVYTQEGGSKIITCLRIGEGKCIHQTTCHHARRKECRPTQLTVCPCILQFEHGVEYDLDWGSTIHYDSKCSAFHGREVGKGSTATFINMPKLKMTPCTQCF